MYHVFVDKLVHWGYGLIDGKIGPSFCAKRRNRSFSCRVQGSRVAHQQHIDQQTHEALGEACVCVCLCLCPRHVHSHIFMNVCVKKARVGWARRCSVVTLVNHLLYAQQLIFLHRHILMLHKRGWLIYVNISSQCSRLETKPIFPHC